MNTIATIGEMWAYSLAWLAGFAVLFLVLTRFSPCNPGRNWWMDRRAAVTDVFYWLLLPLLTQFGRVGLLVLGVLLLYRNDPPVEFVARELPLWVQCLAILFVQDVLMYWIHRLFHTRVGWKFHAVHHSPEVLDWTSTQRFHPVNAILEFALADAVILLMGFSPLALAILGPINLAYSVMVHANLNWTFGPFQYLLASPVFHRWHHTSADEGMDRNFAPTFPFLDLLWGTFYMPAHVRPEIYGVARSDVPTGFFAQMAYPFRGLGSWAFRRPATVSACVATLVAITWLGFAKLEQSDVPNATAEVAEPLPALPVIPRSNATAMAVTAHGPRMILGSGDGTAILRDANSGNEISCVGHSRRINAVGFSPDGKWAATASGDGTARVWDALTGKALRTLDDRAGNVMSVAISTDGWVSAGSVDGSVRIWGPGGSLAYKKAFGAGSIHAVAICEGGRRVAVARFHEAILWEPAANRTVACTGLKNLAYCLAISANGSRAIAGDYDGQLLVWDEGSERPTFAKSAHVGPVYAVALSADNASIVTGGADAIVQKWNATTGENLGRIGTHTDAIFAIAQDATTGRTIAAGKDGKTSIWNNPMEYRERKIQTTGYTERTPFDSK